MILLWALLVGFGARNGWMRPTPAPSGDAAAFLEWAASRYARESAGNMAIVLLDEGRPTESFFASHGRTVDEHTLFQVASLSKWLTAWGVMKLVEEGRIDLDAPVSRYLTRWQLPPSEYDNDAVTIRLLLAHDAGLTDGLGFLGFAPGEDIPTLEQELTHTADVLPSADGVIRVGAEPASGWRYSGGGYLILQLVIEEVSAQDFDTYMRREIFEPLGMRESGFTSPDPARLADIFAVDGSPATHYSFAATGAASLYTSAHDLTLFLQAQGASPGAPAGREVLTAQTLQRMTTPHANLFGLPVWGLGVTLYAPLRDGGYVIGHDGQNHPAINTTARFNPDTGDGVIVLTTGSPTLARSIGGEWTFWQTGKVGWDTLILFDAPYVLLVFATGALLVLTFTTAVIVMRRRRERPTLA
jgi:CubicO group peptidase (beta-lactamase class C family)